MPPTTKPLSLPGPGSLPGPKRQNSLNLHIALCALLLWITCPASTPLAAQNLLLRSHAAPNPPHVTLSDSPKALPLRLTPPTSPPTTRILHVPSPPLPSASPATSVSLNKEGPRQDYPGPWLSINSTSRLLCGDKNLVIHNDFTCVTSVIRGTHFKNPLTAMNLQLYGNHLRFTLADLR